MWWRGLWKDTLNLEWWQTEESSFWPCLARLMGVNDSNFFSRPSIGRGTAKRRIDARRSGRGGGEKQMDTHRLGVELRKEELTPVGVGMEVEKSELTPIGWA